MTATVEGDGIVLLEARGKIERADYDRVVPTLESTLTDLGRLRVLLRPRDFGGWTPWALVEELRFDMRHRHDFERIAVVGATALEEAVTRITAPFFTGDIRFFPDDREADARDWLRA